MVKKSAFDFINLPIDAKLKVRFLDEAVPAKYFVQARDPKNPSLAEPDDLIEATVHAFNSLSKEKTAEEIERDLRSAFPSPLPPAKLRSMLNAVKIEKFAIEVPKRKKKSWMRLCSQKKWARSFPKRFRYERTPIVVAMSSETKQKLADLAAQKLGTFM